MGDFFDELGKKIGDTVDNVGKKTGEVLEVQKLKGQIRTLASGNDRDIIDLGKMVYHRFQKGEVIDNDFIGVCETIEKRENSIEECERKISTVKGAGVCPFCNAPLEKTTIFCPRCGAKVGE
ncbi:MAG: zinc ribbon domain-containing protein [Lachnospiraceae bacterium]